MKRLLVPTDFTAVSDRAVAYGGDLASALGASVILLHAIEPIETHGESAVIDRFYESLRKSAQGKLRASRRRLRERGVQARTVIEVKKRWRSIVDLAERESADIIVMGAHAADGDGRLTIGSTSYMVFLAARSPLLVLRDGGTTVE